VALSETRWAGWRARSRGREVPLVPWGAAFQSVATTPGEASLDLRFDFEDSSALSDELKARLRSKAAARLDAEGQIQITSQLTRNQSDNLEDARQKLAVLLRSAMTTPKARRKTKPSRAKKAKRVAEKRVHAAKKQNRARVSSE